jgi:BlaI family penicillinase repressor
LNFLERFEQPGRMERNSTLVKIPLDVFTLVEQHAPAMPKPEIELTEAEWTVIKAVWDHEPCTAPDIQQKLEGKTKWTYSTVRTLMDRMVTKGLLTAKKERNITLYSTAVTRAQAQRGELLYALKNAFNGALTPMLECLLDTKDLSRDDLDQLKQLIADHEKNRGKTNKK